MLEKTLENSERETVAIEAYLQIIRSKGAIEESISDRRYFLNKLSTNLNGVIQDGTSFRKAVDKVIEKMDLNERRFCLNVAREFYPFWMDDIKSVVSMSIGNIFNLKLLRKDTINKELTEVWSSIETFKFEFIETWPLNGYLDCLKQLDIPKPVCETRLKIAKIIIRELRGNNHFQEKDYRFAVNRALNLFLRNETKELFKKVSREFFYFWSGHPEAERFIVYDDSNSSEHQKKDR